MLRLLPLLLLMDPLLFLMPLVILNYDKLISSFFAPSIDRLTDAADQFFAVLLQLASTDQTLQSHCCVLLPYYRC